jgi:Mrp family chromosome partitioning ATPase
MFGAFGLLLGVGCAYALQRFDNRLRSKADTEEALGVGVVAEVPPMPPDEREQLVVQASPVIEAYRRLRTTIDRWALESDRGQASVVVVTSPLGGEGKTVTVAHLAATFGEIGRTVVAVSADLRHPRLHFYFDKAREPGLADVLRGAPDARRLTDLNLETKVRGVRFVASGVPVRNPAPLLNRIGDHLGDARGMADLVLIDGPPLLTTSDGADVARHADGVLLVVRAGRTSVGAARRSLELLGRLGIPILGAVLIGSNGSVIRTRH